MFKERIVGCGLALVVVIGSMAMDTNAKDGRSGTIESRASGSFVTANFDFDQTDLSTPAFYVHGEGFANKSRFSYQAVVEVAPDNKKCTVRGGTSEAGTEFSLVGRTEVLRFTATGDLLFFSSRPGTDSVVLCADFSKFPTPPFPYIVDEETGIITGGTGAFDGATGTFTATESGAFLSTDPAGKTGFGWFKSHVVITLTRP
jgi:hypothetical protein